LLHQVFCLIIRRHYVSFQLHFWHGHYSQ